jgi:hypothetical protein
VTPGCASAGSGSTFAVSSVSAPAVDAGSICTTCIPPAAPYGIHWSLVVGRHVAPPHLLQPRPALLLPPGHCSAPCSPRTCCVGQLCWLPGPPFCPQPGHSQTPPPVVHLQPCAVRFAHQCNPSCYSSVWCRSTQVTLAGIQVSSGDRARGNTSVSSGPRTFSF